MEFELLGVFVVDECDDEYELEEVLDEDEDDEVRPPFVILLFKEVLFKLPLAEWVKCPDRWWFNVEVDEVVDERWPICWVNLIWA